jgi:hypothetical protein
MLLLRSSPLVIKSPGAAFFCVKSALGFMAALQTLWLRGIDFFHKNT